MGNRLHYLAIGSFLLILSLSAVLLPLWLMSGFTKKHYQSYLAYMNESVTGLTERAPVKYNGVDVGYVEQIRLVPDNPQQVELVLKIAEDVLIYEDTTATLYTQGLTGLTHVGLKGGSALSPLLKAKPGERLPVIKTTPSLLFRLDTLIQNLSLSIMQLSEELRGVVSEENRANFNRLLTHLAHLSQVFVEHSGQIEGALQQLPQLLTTLQQVNRNAEQASALFANQLLPQTIEALAHVQQLAKTLNEVAGSIEENPTLLIRGRAMPAPGPGE